MKAGEEITSVNVAWDADRHVTSSPKGKEEKVVEVKKKEKAKAAPKKVSKPVKKAAKAKKTSSPKGKK